MLTFKNVLLFKNNSWYLNRFCFMMNHREASFISYFCLKIIILIPALNGVNTIFAHHSYLTFNKLPYDKCYDLKGYIIIMFCSCHIYNWMTYMRRQYVWILFSMTNLTLGLQPIMIQCHLFLRLHVTIVIQSSFILALCLGPLSLV